MSEFTVHTVPGSPFARAVLATLEEKGARYRLAPLRAERQQIARASRPPSVRPGAGVRA